MTNCLGQFLSSDGLWHGFLPSETEFFLGTAGVKVCIDSIDPRVHSFFWVCLLKNPTDHDFTHDIPLPLGANPMVSPWGHPGRSPGERWQRKGPKEVPGTASFAAPKDGMQWLKVKQRRKQRIFTGNNSQ